jgi:hypothetical protein
MRRYPFVLRGKASEVFKMVALLASTEPIGKVYLDDRRN